MKFVGLTLLPLQTMDRSRPAAGSDEFPWGLQGMSLFFYAA